MGENGPTAEIDKGIPFVRGAPLTPCLFSLTSPAPRWVLRRTPLLELTPRKSSRRAAAPEFETSPSAATLLVFDQVFKSRSFPGSNS